jgi:hypothetical protein
MTDLSFNIAWIQKNTESLTRVADDLDKIALKLDELDHKDADPKVNVDTAEANAKLDDLNKKLNNLKVSQAGAGILGGLVGAGAIVGAGLLTIPAAIVAIGAAAEKTDPQVSAAFSNMANQAKQTAQVGFAPLAPTLANFGNEATTALGQVRGQLAQSAEAAAPMVDVIGKDFLQAAQEGIGASVPIIKQLGPVAQAAGGDLIAAERGAVGFFAALDPGPAVQGLSALGTQVGDLLPKVGTLVNDVVPLGNDLLNLVGPALNDTAQDAHLLAVPLQAVGSAIGFVGPVAGAVIPPVLALAGASKLLTGSWTDWRGAAQKLISPITNFDGVLTGVANKIGITTAAQNEANKADVTAAVVKAQLAKQAAETNAIQAAFAAEEAATAESELAAVAATDELTAAEAALTEAETAAAAAAEGLTFSLGPIGLVLGAAGAAAALFGLNSQNTNTQVQDLSQQIIQLGQSSPGAAAGLAAGSGDLQKYSTELNTLGTTAQQFAATYSGDINVATQYTKQLAKEQDDLGGKILTASDVGDRAANMLGMYGRAAGDAQKSVKDLTDAVNSDQDAYKALSPAAQHAVDQYNALHDIVPQAQNALKNMQAAQQAEQAALVQEGIVLPAVTQGWNNLGNAIAKRAADFDTATAGIRSMTDAAVAVSATFFQDQQTMAQLQQSAIQAAESEQQAEQGVANAVHSQQQAILGVAQARQGEQQAVIGVQNAQNALAKAERTVQQDELALSQARIGTLQNIIDLQRQATDQTDTEAEAQLRLLDAQDAVNKAGLQGKTLASLGPLTTADEEQYKLLLTLQEAQHNLNDVTAQSQKINAQNAAAQAAGVDGSQQVISATQQLSDAQDQAKQSAQGVIQAQQGVTSASQAVANAQWGEQQASAAVHQANLAEQAAKLALQQANAANSMSTDLNTAAGVRNFQMIEQLFKENQAVTPNIDQATAATEQQAAQFGINKVAVDAVITSLTKIPVSTPFAIIGTPSLNLSALVQQAQAQGIDPFTLGLDRHDVSLAIGDIHGHATGGLISGPGTGTSDSILAGTDNGGLLRVSNGEYIVNAADTAKNLGLLEAINSGAVTGFASGGQVDGKKLMAVNFRLAAWDGFLQGVSHGLQSFGINTPKLPAATAAIDFGAFGGGIPAAGSVGGGVVRWAPVILQALALNGQPASWLATVERRMNQESGGDPTVVNKWDSNWAKGTPSVGLMQVIAPTFRSNAGQFLNTGPFEYGVSIDPLANTYAGVHYALGRYHTLAALDRPGGYSKGGVVALKPPKVLDSGGYVDPGLHLYYNGTGQPERTRTAAQEDALLGELRALRDDIRNLAQVNVHAPQGASVDVLAAEVMRRLKFHGR